MKRATALLIFLLMLALPTADAQFSGCKPGFCSPSATAPVVSSETWNPLDKSASVTLSVANTVATNVNTFAGVRSLGSHTTGKWYAEFFVTTMTGNIFDNDGLGLCTAATPLTAINQDPTSFWSRSTDGLMFNGNPSTTKSTGVLQGNTIGVAYDGSLNLVWMRNDVSPGSNSWVGTTAGANPATGTFGFNVSTTFGGNPVFLCMSGDNSTTDVVAIHHTFTYSPPVGYAPW